MVRRVGSEDRYRTRLGGGAGPLGTRLTRPAAPSVGPGSLSRGLTAWGRGHTLNHMVKHLDLQLDATFAALAHPVRRGIVARLSEGPRSVGGLAEPFAMSLPAVSKHVRVLERAGLLEQTKVGRERRCRLNAAPMREAYDFVKRYRRYWTAQLDALAEFVETSTLEREDPT